VSWRQKAPTLAEIGGTTVVVKKLSDKLKSASVAVEEEAEAGSSRAET
jgi:hypothetical protein